MTVILKFKGWLLAITAVLLSTAVLAADPTQPEAQLQRLTAAGATQTATPALPKLSMIRSQGSHQQALINGQWLKAGEKIGAYQVRSISASQVTLVQGERSLVLNLFQTTTTTK
ncbi:hypothetical protein A5320_04960 [Rheinheimera sp. SA_1]|uniref:hypothetical protein n=1 Tax=Rheinheimera sp. SA_1 TaxID=1827365 RepID=UPI0007FF7324|nr:hypothetical protein [Rheinheimera sp. SA_1]OBP16732.1 hypothetical protein A5320_04960 [Rheinheimera sp. SA_1]